MHLAKLDDASWHYGGDGFPDDAPAEHGATHIGIFVKLAFEQGMAGSLPLEEAPDAVARVVSGEMTGTDFVMSELDGKLTSEDLNDEGFAFANWWWNTLGTYFFDYEASGIVPYEQGEEEVNMTAMRNMFLQRLREFRAQGEQG